MKVGASIDESLHLFFIPLTHCLVEWRPATLVYGIDTGVDFGERLGDIWISFVNVLMEWHRLAALIYGIGMGAGIEFRH